VKSDGAQKPGLIQTRPLTGTHKSNIDVLVGPALVHGYFNGLVIGLIENDRQHVFTYGADLNEYSIFEIGSITKVFTALALACMVHEGALALDDPVRKFLPPEVVPGPSQPPEITLLNLATHTSGLPRLPANFAPDARSNPYYHYKAEHLYCWLSRRGLRNSRVPKYRYSNIGYALLGHVLSLCVRQPYTELIHLRILSPLSLSDTTSTLSPEQQTRLAAGHTLTGKPSSNWQWNVCAPAGALYSTVSDMLRFLAVHLAISRISGTGHSSDTKCSYIDTVSHELASAIALTIEPRASVRRGYIGLGWHLKADSDFCWHNGATGGYSSYVSFSGKKQIGVVVVANRSTGLLTTRLGICLENLLTSGEIMPLRLLLPQWIHEWVLRLRLLAKSALVSGATQAR